MREIRASLPVVGKVLVKISPSERQVANMTAETLYSARRHQRRGSAGFILISTLADAACVGPERGWTLVRASPLPPRRATAVPTSSRCEERFLFTTWSSTGSRTSVLSGYF